MGQSSSSSRHLVAHGEDDPVHGQSADPAMDSSSSSFGAISRRKPDFVKEESNATIATNLTHDGDSSSHYYEDSSAFSCHTQFTDGGIHDFTLKRRRKGHKPGVEWQEDPTGKTWLHHGRHWPRDYATIRGSVVEVDGKKWLLATHVKQLGGTEWNKAPKGAALPFFYKKTHCLVYKRKKDAESERPLPVKETRDQ